MRWVYAFGGGEADGGRDDRQLLGSKGAQLGEMSRLGLNVPPGFTITAEACRHFLSTGDVPTDLWSEVEEAMSALEARSLRRFGDTAGEPLLVSVRSGAAVSMPGMMDTVLNLGSTDGSIAALARASDERFALDCHRRFVQLFGEVVAGVDHGAFEAALTAARAEAGVDRDDALGSARLATLVDTFRRRVAEVTGRRFPEDPWEQLRAAVLAVFGSWDTPRAREYRRVNHIADDLGTAVSIMMMVYGNRGEDSASGVAFTRDPSTGEPRLYGEFLVNAQGEDVVAGTRDPQPLAELAHGFPEALPELEEVRRILEAHYRDMQDLEFTIERGELFVLQTRTGKRTGRAAVRIAVDMVGEGLIDRSSALLRVDPDAIEQLLHPSVDPSAEVVELGRG
ncbi:MAG TPA: PEP/pyruvate-binding domain-containing protein, partial [Longimicrobiales bacterium]|nr:PEP/pyruvate-binding domain-containing protein [Longimicrobiales bacterium]